MIDVSALWTALRALCNSGTKRRERSRDVFGVLCPKTEDNGQKNDTADPVHTLDILLIRAVSDCFKDSEAINRDILLVAFGLLEGYEYKLSGKGLKGQLTARRKKFILLSTYGDSIDIDSRITDLDDITDKDIENIRAAEDRCLDSLTKFIAGQDIDKYIKGLDDYAKEKGIDPPSVLPKLSCPRRQCVVNGGQEEAGIDARKQSDAPFSEDKFIDEPESQSDSTIDGALMDQDIELSEPSDASGSSENNPPEIEPPNPVPLHGSNIAQQCKLLKGVVALLLIIVIVLFYVLIQKDDAVHDPDNRQPVNESSYQDPNTYLLKETITEKMNADGSTEIITEREYSYILPNPPIDDEEERAVDSFIDNVIIFFEWLNNLFREDE